MKTSTYRLRTMWPEDKDRWQRFIQSESSLIGDYNDSLREEVHNSKEGYTTKKVHCTKMEPKEEPKEEPKQEPKQAPKEELKELKEEPEKEFSKHPKKSSKEDKEFPLFSGLVFTFIPDSASKYREFKKRLFAQHGAAVVDSVTSSMKRRRLSQGNENVAKITHILVDINYKWSQIEAYIDKLPINLKTAFLARIHAGVPVLRETWPSDCLEKGKLVDYTKPVYEVPGRVERDSLLEEKKSVPTNLTPSDELVEISSSFDEKEVSDTETSLPIASGSGSPLRRKGDWATNLGLLDPPSHNTQPPSDSHNPNQRTIEKFAQMMQHYIQTNDSWRVQSYRKAIATLQAQTTPIMTRQQAQLLPGFGAHLASKLEEIVQTNHLAQLDETNNNNNNDNTRMKTLTLFRGIFGVGPHTATKWYNAGLRTLNDLLTHDEEDEAKGAGSFLTPQQRIGIERYNDFQARIPRAEVERHFQKVKDVAEEMDPRVQCFLMGSYRRGARSCGDIDIILTKPDNNRTTKTTATTSTSINKSELWEFLQRLTGRLTEIGFLKACLVGDNGHNRHKSSKWYGASVLPDSGIWRRIDFLIVPWSELGASLLYFTGNDLFNRSIRLLASKKGMSLNQHGLFKDVVRGRDRKASGGILVESHDERKIFEALGVAWRDPEDRNVG